uniref:Protein kinase domain-containing protein n=2 Tax=Zea mays TaxID=4577 RepID=A0A804MD67_MAIZE
MPAAERSAQPQPQFPPPRRAFHPPRSPSSPRQSAPPRLTPLFPALDASLPQRPAPPAHPSRPPSPLPEAARVSIPPLAQGFSYRGRIQRTPSRNHRSRAPQCALPSMASLGCPRDPLPSIASIGCPRDPLPSIAWCPNVVAPTPATSAAARGQPPPASGVGGILTSSSKEDLGGDAFGSAAAVAAAAAAAAGEQSRLVFVGKGAGYSFNLEDLLRASAEVLGKGSVGTSYKVVLEEGTTVVVKRLKDVAVQRREFDAHMEALGRVEHRNMLPIRAYYFSKDEKLLVYDYLPNGSLSAMLHVLISGGGIAHGIIFDIMQERCKYKIRDATTISYRL